MGREERNSWGDVLGAQNRAAEHMRQISICSSGKPHCLVLIQSARFLSHIRPCVSTALHADTTSHEGDCLLAQGGVIATSPPLQPDSQGLSASLPGGHPSVSKCLKISPGSSCLQCVHTAFSVWNSAFLSHCLVFFSNHVPNFKLP